MKNNERLENTVTIAREKFWSDRKEKERLKATILKLEEEQSAVEEKCCKMKKELNDWRSKNKNIKQLDAEIRSNKARQSKLQTEVNKLNATVHTASSKIKELDAAIKKKEKELEAMTANKGNDGESPPKRSKPNDNNEIAASSYRPIKGRLEYKRVTKDVKKSPAAANRHTKEPEHARVSKDNHKESKFVHKEPANALKKSSRFYIERDVEKKSPTAADRDTKGPDHAHVSKDNQEESKLVHEEPASALKKSPRDIETKSPAVVQEKAKDVGDEPKVDKKDEEKKVALSIIKQEPESDNAGDQIKCNEKQTGKWEDSECMIVEQTGTQTITIPDTQVPETFPDLQLEDIDPYYKKRKLGLLSQDENDKDVIPSSQENSMSASQFREICNLYNQPTRVEYKGECAACKIHFNKKFLESSETYEIDINDSYACPLAQYCAGFKTHYQKLKNNPNYIQSVQIIRANRRIPHTKEVDEAYEAAYKALWILP